MQGPSLFSVHEERAVYSVSEITGELRARLEAEYSDVEIEGELTNFTHHRSGHCYFSLSDGEAQLRCVMWKPFAQQLRFKPKDGMLVRVSGDISVYERRGDLQLKARAMRMAGEGARQKAFEELKRKLSAEGLFEEERKRPLPAFPQKLGIITSGDGAALHDICTVLKRRFPLVECVLCSVAVQGMAAAAEIARAIDGFNALPKDDPQRPDLLIVGRGGGSAEDLWAFNEEPVARALSRSTIPTISAVGHETDLSIADLVADRRAATPSMAAEIAVPDATELGARIRALDERAGEYVRTGIAQLRERVDRLSRSYGLRRPKHELQSYKQRLHACLKNLRRAGSYRVQQKRNKINTLQKRLTLLDPERPLKRGYARVERDEEAIGHAEQLKEHDLVTLHFQDGHRTARIQPES